MHLLDVHPTRSRRATVGAFGVLLATTGLAVACGGHTPTADHPHAIGTVARRAPPCEGEARCTVVGRTAAGRDAEDVPLFVVEINRGRYAYETGTPTEDPDAAACELREFWLERASVYELTLTLCNDGYGASGVGEDGITVGENRLVHDQYGGSAWRWSAHRVFQLYPRRELRADDQGFWAVGRNVEQRTFDFATFQGRVDWYAPVCGPEENEGGGEIGVLPPGRVRSYLVLPILQVDAAVDPARHDLGPCATRLDGSEGRSFLLEGAPGSPDDAWLELLAAASGEVTVVIHDDAFVPGGDRLTIHVAEATPTYFDACLDPTTAYRTYVYDAATLEVLEGEPSEAGIRAGVARSLRFVRLPLGVEPGGGGLTVAYTDADVLDAPERTFASSAFRDGDASTLGARSFELATRVTCALVRDGLTRRVVDEPVLPGFPR